MDKIQWIVAGVEAIVFLLPLLSLLVKTASWKKEVDMKVEAVTTEIAEEKKQAIMLKESLDKMNVQLIDISVKVGLLLDNKIRGASTDAN